MTTPIDKSVVLTLPSIIDGPELTDWLKRYTHLIPTSDSSLVVIDPERKQAAETRAKEAFPYMFRTGNDCSCDDPNCPHKGPISGLGMYVLGDILSKDKKLYMQKWEPLEYPIIKMNSVHDLYTANCLELLCEKVGSVPNMGRVMIPLELEWIQATNFIRLQFVEGIFFEKEVPETIEIIFNGNPVCIKPDNQYISLNMLPFYAAPYTQVQLLYRDNKYDKLVAYIVYHRLLGGTPEASDLLRKDHGEIFDCKCGDVQLQCINGMLSPIWL